MATQTTEERHGIRLLPVLSDWEIPNQEIEGRITFVQEVKEEISLQAVDGEPVN